jgi:hypothetical protein
VNVCVSVYFCRYTVDEHVIITCGEGYVAFYATPNPFLLNKVCLNEGVKTRLGESDIQ